MDGSRDGHRRQHATLDPAGREESLADRNRHLGVDAVGAEFVVDDERRTGWADTEDAEPPQQVAE